jgi:DNA-binding transcriptional LysR family regulator
MIYLQSYLLISHIAMANIRNIDMNLLAVFDALFDERSVTRAAGRLALTQPTVSGMLQRLRYTFSDPLFVRTSHGMLSTPRAETLAGPIKQLLTDAQLLVKAEAFEPATAEGTIKLCASDYLQHAFIIPLIRVLRRRAPKLKVSVAPRQASGLADLMARGEIDLYVSNREVADPDLPSLLLYRDRYICVARKSHPLRRRRISVKQLCTFDHLLVHPTGRSLSGPIDAVLAGVGQRRRVAAAVPSFPVLFELLANDDFIAFVPERLLRNHRSDLKIFETGLKIPPFDVISSWHPRVSGDARHKWLREMLLAVAGAHDKGA